MLNERKRLWYALSLQTGLCRWVVYQIIFLPTTSSSNLGCTNSKTMFLDCWTNSRPGIAPIKRSVQKKGKEGMSASGPSDSLMNPLMMDSEGSIDASLQIRMTATREV